MSPAMTRPPQRGGDAAPAIARGYFLEWGFARSDIFTRWWSGFVRIRALTISVRWHPYRACGKGSGRG